MASRKTKPPPPPKKSVSIKPLLSANAINEMLGSDISDLSHVSNNHSDEEAQHSPPQFSFLPSDRTSSPVAHAIASMSTVPNSGLPQNTRASSRNSSVPAATPTPNRSRRKSSPKAYRQNGVLRDIHQYQNSTELLIPKLPFSRLIREILSDYTHKNLRVTPQMLLCVHEAAEIYIVQLLEDAARCAHHRDRVTVQVKDMHLAQQLRR